MPGWQDHDSHAVAHLAYICIQYTLLDMRHIVDGSRNSDWVRMCRTRGGKTEANVVAVGHCAHDVAQNTLQTNSIVNNIDRRGFAVYLHRLRLRSPGRQAQAVISVLSERT